MYNIEDIYSQALDDVNAIHRQKSNGYCVINNGVKIQKFPSKTEILNCSRSGDFFQECNKEEYNLFL